MVGLWHAGELFVTQIKNNGVWLTYGLVTAEELQIHTLTPEEVLHFSRQGHF